MNTESIKQQLHHYLEVADVKKLKAIYTMVEDDIKESMVEEYTPEFKKDLEARVNYYLQGGKMITPAEMNKKLKAARNKKK